MKPFAIYIPITFLLTTFLTVYFFYKASKESRILLAIASSWLVLQGAVALTGFYTVTDTKPPRLLLLLLPPLAMIFFAFFTPGGRSFTDQFDIKMLTVLHIIRIPVELVLYWLFLAKAVPEIMTFAGRNFDILSGITAPLVYYFGFVKKRLDPGMIVLWNVVCLLLLANIVVTAILSAPMPFQQFAFDQPNIAILYFPFVWLPGCIVPMVLFSHLAVLRQLLYGQRGHREDLVRSTTIFHEP